MRKDTGKRFTIGYSEIKITPRLFCPSLDLHYLRNRFLQHMKFIGKLTVFFFASLLPLVCLVADEKKEVYKIRKFN